MQRPRLVLKPKRLVMLAMALPVCKRVVHASCSHIYALLTLCESVRGFKSVFNASKAGALQLGHTVRSQPQWAAWLHGRFPTDLDS